MAIPSRASFLGFACERAWNVIPSTVGLLGKPSQLQSRWKVRSQCRTARAYKSTWTEMLKCNFLTRNRFVASCSGAVGRAPDVMQLCNPQNFAMPRALRLSDGGNPAADRGCLMVFVCRISLPSSLQNCAWPCSSHQVADPNCKTEFGVVKAFSRKSSACDAIRHP